MPQRAKPAGNIWFPHSLLPPLAGEVPERERRQPGKSHHLRAERNADFKCGGRRDDRSPRRLRRLSMVLSA